MENCLVAKLKGSVNNPNLELFGYIPVKISESGDAKIFISITSDVIVKTSSNVKLVVDNVEYDTYTYAAGNWIPILAHSKDGNNGYVFLGDKYSATTFLGIIEDDDKSLINFESIEYITSLVNLSGPHCTGQLSSLSNLVNLDTLSFTLNNDDVYGDISSLSGLTSLVDFRLYSQNVTGELKNIANPNIELVDVRSSNVFGSVEDFADILAPNKNNGDVVTVVCSEHITYNGELIGNTHGAIITFNGSGGYNVVVQ